LTLARCLLLSLALLVAACTAPAPGQPESATSAPPTTGTAPPPKPAGPAPPSPSPSPSPSPVPLAEITLRLAIESPGAAHWPLLVAERKGIFRNYALRLETAAGLPTDELIERLKTSRADAGVATGEALILSSQGGPPLTMLAGLLNKPAYSLIGARDVASPAGLKGQSLGVDDSRPARNVLLKRLLATQGLGDADYQLVGVGTAATHGAAVMNGTVAASLVDYPQAAQLVRQRFRSVGSGVDAAPEYQAEALVARPEWARSGDGPVRLVRALLEAEAWLHDPRNKQEAASILAEATQTTVPDNIATYEVLIERTQAIPRDGAVSQAGVLRVIQFLGEAEQLRSPLPPVERFVDTTVLDRARTLRR
jgi:ABC-type nitrate/sulfonate/bicarbonate transport system substrate-binding protein